MTEPTHDIMEIWAAKIVRWASGSHALLVIIFLLVAWIVFGPLFGFSLDWQSSMTVPATAITFLLVFLILRAQNKDTRAIQLKLNEIIAAVNGANNQLIDIENQSEHALEELHKRYETIASHINSDADTGPVTDSIAPHELIEEIV